MLDEWDVVYIDKIESHQPRFLRRRLKAYTPSTLTDPVALRQELAREAAADASGALGGAEVRRD